MRNLQSRGIYKREPMSCDGEEDIRTMYHDHVGHVANAEPDEVTAKLGPRQSNVNVASPTWLS